MSSVIGIICEYNPFHKGHKYQVDKIREIEKDATIVAIMSGNVVQRGEFAIIDKYYRTRMALECGIDIVFELPYPYCGSTAEIFASAGVELAYRLGCDAIYFGTELSSITELENIAYAIDSPEFETEIKRVTEDKNINYILAKEKALCNFEISLPKSANDMLGVEYIRAINKKRLTLKYNTIQRKGALYNDTNVGQMMSASAIRKNFYENTGFMSVPFDIMTIYDEIVAEKYYLDAEYTGKFLHTHILLSGDKLSRAFDTSAEMVALIQECVKNNVSLENKLSSKAFTTARLKRSVLYSVFGVETVDFTPQFTILLGMNNKGQSHVNKIKKKTDFYIITKHSDGKNMPILLKEQLERLYLVDEIYNTLLVNKKVPANAFKNKPIIKK